MDSAKPSGARPGWDTGDWSGLPPVAVHPYDPRWPDQYQHARQQIADVLAGLDVRIEHIGSTAVPGLSARAGIDIMIGLTDPADLATIVERLESLGFAHHFSQPEWTHLSGRGCKLHLTPLGSARWSDQLLFRDYLRRHPEDQAAYQQLKQDLARACGADGQRYVDGKTAFVRSVVERARAERDLDGDGRSRLQAPPAP
jgi:GrpB-like predicted nucleotidyltransferase (UPF0157 family)